MGRRSRKNLGGLVRPSRGHRGTPGWLVYHWSNPCPNDLPSWLQLMPSVFCSTRGKCPARDENFQSRGQAFRERPDRACLKTYRNAKSDQLLWQDNAGPTRANMVKDPDQGECRPSLGQEPRVGLVRGDLGKQPDWGETAEVATVYPSTPLAEQFSLMSSSLAADIQDHSSTGLSLQGFTYC